VDGVAGNSRLVRCFGELDPWKKGSSGHRSRKGKGNNAFFAIHDSHDIDFLSFVKIFLKNFGPSGEMDFQRLRSRIDFTSLSIY
jgi:hypothetical protein